MKTLSLITVASWATIAGLASMAAATEPTKAKKIDLPQAPQEVADLLTRTVGTWICKGKAWMPDGSEHVMVGTLTTTKHFDGFWVHDAWNGKMDTYPFRMDTYSTYDAKLRKWRRVGVDSLGGQMIGTADAEKDGKLDFETEVSGPMGAVRLREHLDASVAQQLTITVERSMEKGKGWQRDYEVVCTK